MVDHTDRFRPLQMTPGCYRIPDGHIVPNPPQPEPEPGPAVTRRQYAYGWAVTGLVLALVLIGVLT